jgi:hypothetical protein
MAGAGAGPDDSALAAEGPNVTASTEQERTIDRWIEEIIDGGGRVKHLLCHHSTR